MRLFRLKLSNAHTVVFAVLVMVSFAAAIGVAVALPPIYAAKAQVLLVGPNIGTDGRTTNPFLQFTPALNVTADVLVYGTQRQQTSRSVLAHGGTKEYTVVASTANSEPIITVTGQGGSPAEAETTARLVVSSMKADLAERQTSAPVPTNLRVRMVSIVDPLAATRITKKAIEYAVAVLVGGLVVSVLIVVLLDSRRRKRAESSDSAIQGDADGHRPTPSSGGNSKRPGHGPRPGPNLRPLPAAAGESTSAEPVAQSTARHANGSGGRHDRSESSISMWHPGPR